jgi:hypothetical protein
MNAQALRNPVNSRLVGNLEVGSLGPECHSALPVATCQHYPQCLIRQETAGRGRRQPVGWDKEASCVSRTPLNGRVSGWAQTGEETNLPLAI